MSTFFDMGLSNYIIKATADMGFEEATPIQEKTIPVAMSGRDIIGQAQTGTGKTAAFAIPMIENMERYPEGIGGLVVTPTRELAVQVAEEINKIGQFKGIHAQPIYGGQDINRQIRALRNRPQIIVGTPGRLMDHMRRSTIRLNNVSMVVLDEADEMLSMGFIEDIENILGEIEQQHQTMLFSATMPQSILNLSKRFMNEPEFISIKAKEVTVPNTEQYYIELPERQKFDVLCRLLDIQSPDLAIVFGRTKRRVDELYEALNKRGYSAEGIHGDLTQLRRDSVLRHFKEGVTDILVATDVAARGLDISGVTHIYNFDIPQDPESYVHRIGRTGRAGKTGLAVTFVTPREQNHLRLIEQVTKRRIIRKPMPTINEALEGQQRITMEQLIKAVDDPESHRYIELAEELLDSNDSTTLLAAALKLLTKEPNTTPVILTEESPVFSRSPRYEKPRQTSYYQRNRRNRPDIRTDGRNDYRPESRPENRSYNRPENRSGNRPDYRTNNRPDYRSNSHNDYRTDIRPDYRTNNRTEQISDSKTDNSSE